jgi:predicted acyl esterase
MRDGVRLNTSIYAPKNPAAPLPFLIKRSPYGIGDGISAEAFSNPQSSLRELVDDGYIFVFQDIRGRYKSEGKFVMQRPPRDKNDPKAIDESTDAHDTIAWLLKNVPNHNGRAGIFGVSYDGWLAAMAMLDPHPALKAVSPQASPADMFLGDDFHHNGAFRLSYGFEYAAMMETSNIKMSGYQLMIANEVFRGRFRKSFEKPEPIAPNQVNEYMIDLHSLNHRFGTGHRIMVQVQSTWFPVIDRNPQKYVENIFLAKASDYQAATQRVFRSPQFPSHVTVPVVTQ